MDYTASLALTASLQHPAMLAVCALAAVPVLLARRAAKHGRRVGAASVLLQCLAMLLAAAALAGPTVPSPSSELPWLVFADHSASACVQRDAPPPLPDGIRSERYAFAADLARDAAPMDETQTNVAPALRLAAGRVEKAAGVVIRTDGRFSDDWRPDGRRLGAAGLPVRIVPMRSPPGDARVAGLSAARGENGTVGLTLTIASTSMQKRDWSVMRSDPGGLSPVGGGRLSLLPGESATLRLTDAATGPERTVEYVALLSGGDPFPENDAATALVVPRTARVAVVSAGAPPPRVPGGGGLPPAEAPTDAAGWMDHACVVLVDGAGTLLSAAQREALAEYVRNGGGLVLVGAAPHASPADRDDPLHRVAALVANPYERKPLKLIVALDASGSMAERGPDDSRIKFDLARQAVLSLKEHLTRRDALRIITFAERAQSIYDSGTAEPSFPRVADALAGVAPTGPTKVVPALRLAAKSKPPEGKDGLLIVVTDLATGDEDFRVARLAESLRQAGWKLAIVATGGARMTETPPLALLAEEMDAPLVAQENLAGLARVFARLLRRGRGDPVRRGEYFAVDAAGKPLAWPAVEAYLPSAENEGARVAARVEADPLIARRPVGLGRSVSIAVDPAGSAALLESDAFGRTLAAEVAWAQSPAVDPRFSGEISRDGGELRISVEARDADGPVNLLDLMAEAAPAEASAEPVRGPMRQTAPGRYEGRLPAPHGAIVLHVRETSGRPVWRKAIGGMYPPEFTATGADWESLNRLAELTGGQIVSMDELAASIASAPAMAPTPVWRWALLAALACMLAEWALTRVQRA